MPVTLLKAGRVGHKPNEPEFQRQCLKRYITKLEPLLRREFVRRLEARHGAEWVQGVREA